MIRTLLNTVDPDLGYSCSADFINPLVTVTIHVCGSITWNSVVPTQTYVVGQPEMQIPQPSFTVTPPSCSSEVTLSLGPAIATGPIPTPDGRVQTTDVSLVGSYTNMVWTATFGTGTLSINSDPFTLEIACGLISVTLPALSDVSYTIGDPQIDLPEPVLTYDPPACGPRTLTLQEVVSGSLPAGINAGSPINVYSTDLNLVNNVYWMKWVVDGIDPAVLIVGSPFFTVSFIPPVATMVINGPLVIDYDMAVQGGAVLSTPVPFTVKPALCQPDLLLFWYLNPTLPFA